jgi:guanine deaminase
MTMPRHKNSLGTPDPALMQRVIDLSIEKMHAGFGGPFAALVAKDGKVIAEGWNCVTSSNDPTAHAEVTAIRRACEALGTFQLEGCEVYTSCEPCPMCLGAIYWSRPERVFYSCTRQDAAEVGFDDEFIYDQVELHPAERRIPMTQLMQDEGRRAFEAWSQKADRIEY